MTSQIDGKFFKKVSWEEFLTKCMDDLDKLNFVTASLTNHFTLFVRAFKEEMKGGNDKDGKVRRESKGI